MPICNYAPSGGTCDFETDTCDWTNSQTGDDFDWLRNRGSTTSQFTGPSSDHTKVGVSNLSLKHVHKV
ncbi:hypothetical protein DPMN_011718 [Dreissena polymorpha]|uniref:MAM domain-containing protein n=1 Tax=Dreissena polymorpha TaxID=45954 RepID=A0A9D4S0A6_DREPO|nr:hypothetical protein DPMN_011718 [Dreissena polymorpha]